jgi:fructoselysine-6-P-deglycase FrlB-like protein
MNRSAQPIPSCELLAEINEQVRSLQELGKFYQSAAGIALLESLPPAGRYLFAGCGPEILVSQLAAQLCCSQGVDASAVDADTLAQWPDTLLGRFTRIFAFSPAVAEEIANHVKLEQVVSFTGAPENKQSQYTGMLLPTFAGPEAWPGSKTFLADIVVSWLVSRRLAPQRKDNETEQLKRLRQRIQLLLEGSSALLEQWQRCLSGCNSLLLYGRGEQARVAARASLCLFDWAGIQASVIPETALSHPLAAGWAVIECCDSALSASILEPARSNPTIRLIDGFPQHPDDPLRPAAVLPAGLGILLNWVSLQLLARDLKLR